MTNKSGIYLNNAAAGLMTEAVTGAICRHLALEAEVGAYDAATRRQSQLDQGYVDAAELLGCGTDEIAFTGSTTHGWQAAILSLRLQRGDVVLVGENEWGANLRALRRMEVRDGLVVKVVPSEADGTLSLGALAALLDDDRVRLVQLTWLSAAGGTLQPAAATGALTRAAGVPFFLDAAQVIGHLPVDTSAIGCDILVGPGRKWLRGPRGTGLLFAARAFLDRFEPPLVDQFGASIVEGIWRLRPDARRIETAERPVALQLGLCAALRLAVLEDAGDRRDRIVGSADALRRRLAESVGIYGADSRFETHGLVTFSVPGLSASTVKVRLAERGISVAAIDPSFAPLDRQCGSAGGLVRASPHVFTTAQDIDVVEEVLCTWLRDLHRH